MLKKVSFFLVAAFALCIVLAAQAASADPINLGISGFKPSYRSGQDISGALRINYTRLIPQDAYVEMVLDADSPEKFNLISVLPNESLYTFAEKAFSYKITADGKRVWEEYPMEKFQYEITLSVSCGGSNCPGGVCDCSQPKCNSPCSPSACQCFDQYSDNTRYDYVSANNGRKTILDLVKSNSVYYPPSAINVTQQWIVRQVQATKNEKVILEMREACGNSLFHGRQTDPDGWIRRSVTPVRTAEGCNLSLEFRFDERSLFEDRNRFVKDGDPGGIYHVDKRSGASTYLDMGNFSYYSGSKGLLTLKTCNTDTYTYKAVYLPPNGQVLCAYTESVRMNGTESRKITIPFVGTDEHDQRLVCSYGRPYNFTFTEGDISSYLPSCPGYVNQNKCMADFTYEINETEDTTNSVNLSFNPSLKEVIGSCPEADLSKAYIVNIGMGNFSLKAPEAKANHTLTARILYQAAAYAEKSFVFASCNDTDNDGYCSALEEGDDCNDNSQGISPGAKEKCNGLDDDCDGKTDEDFNTTNSIIGTNCSVGQYCPGTYVCTADGSGTQCKPSKPVTEEVCRNSIDDDCDGLLDEDGSMLIGGVNQTCIICVNGNATDCGTDEGECSKGRKTCANGKWGVCVGGILPADEACNKKDDDCNGAVDDVGRGSSIDSTKCGCYGNAVPSSEVCNNIDDDCDGQTDEGVACCSTGERRFCGTDTGICKKGTQTCTDGAWGECKGEARPRDEACANGLDDDCDGQTDEAGCVTDDECLNGRLDSGEEGVDCGGPCPTPCNAGLIWVSVIGIIVVVSFLIFIAVK